MVDQEVVDILAEIRERVASSQTKTPAADGNSTPTAHQNPALNSSVAKGHFASLSVLDRAWDRLPPLITKRTGNAARLDLWVKSKLKRALRWLTWEQVNFNSATRETLHELVEAQAQLELQQHELRNEFLSQLRELTEELKNQRAALLAETTAQRKRFERQQGELNAHRSLLSSQQAEVKDLSREIQSKTVAVDELVKEFRERDERLLDEQRVCFRQLALQLSESQVLQDRARRELEVRVRKLEGKEK